MLTRFACFFLATLALADTAPITDETLRMAALKGIFPGMQISLVPGKRIGDPSPKAPEPYELDTPDALASENVYQVIGKPANEAEQCAAEDLEVSGRFSDARVLRFQLFHWPHDNDLLGVLQYNFEGANPAGSCWSVGLLARLEHAGGRWIVQEVYSLNAHHQSMLLSVRLLDLSGRGADKLVVEPDFGGAGTWGSSLQIFDLSHSKLEEVLEVISRISYEVDEKYTQELDIPRTIEQRGGRFCFSKTTMFEGGKPSIPPLVTKPCYNPGEGVDLQESEERNKLLAPLPKP